MNKKTETGLDTYINKQCEKKTKKRWKQTDLTVLKREFCNGTRLKVIARILNRTETSINKELSRSGIRLQNNKLDKQFVIARQTNCNKKQTNNLTVVINYLKSKKYNITSVKQNLTNDGVALYQVNNVHMSATRLLVIANKHRLEDRLPVFCMKEPED